MTEPKEQNDFTNNSTNKISKRFTDSPPDYNELVGRRRKTEKVKETVKALNALSTTSKVYFLYRSMLTLPNHCIGPREFYQVITTALMQIGNIYHKQ